MSAMAREQAPAGSARRRLSVQTEPPACSLVAFALVPLFRRTRSWRRPKARALASKVLCRPVGWRVDLRVNQLELPPVAPHWLEQHQTLAIDVLEFRQHRGKPRDNRCDCARRRSDPNPDLLEPNVVKSMLLDQLALIESVQLVDVRSDQGLVATCCYVGQELKILLALPTDRLNMVYLMSRQHVDKRIEYRQRHLFIEEDLHAKSRRRSIVVIVYVTIKRYCTLDTNARDRWVEAADVLERKAVRCEAGNRVVRNSRVLDDRKAIECVRVDLYAGLGAVERHDCGTSPSLEFAKHVFHGDEQALARVFENVDHLAFRDPDDRAAIADEAIPRQVLHIGHRLKVGYGFPDLLERELRSKCGEGTDRDQVSEAIPNRSSCARFRNEEWRRTRAPVAELVNRDTTQRRRQCFRIRHNWPPMSTVD
jgi:hypothetical protein